jgi:hypothetical protein
MDTENTITMLTEVLEEFIIYMYDKCKNEEFNYEFILNKFVDCEEDDTIKLFIFNLFQKNIYYNQIQKHIKDDTWFFVDEYSCANSYVATYVSFYHQNQKIQHISNYEIKKDILKKMGI